MLDGYNKLVDKWLAIEKEMREELVRCGFVDKLNKAREEEEFDEIIELIKSMEDSPSKAYVKRRLRQDYGIDWDNHGQDIEKFSL
tara:strand:+ start:13114 stop:13368 length:255 start_codon:yes stop_codon:yes gene_type:complete